MVSRTTTLIVCAIRLVPILSFGFAGCTCSGGPAVNPTPTVPPTSRAAAIPPTVPRPTETPVPAPPTAPAEATSTLPPAPNAGGTAGEASSACEGYVAVLSGKKQDKASMDNPTVRALAQQVPDLVSCGAVRLDSEALCMLLGTDPQQGQTQQCLTQQGLFHELRAYPKKPSFFMTESEWRGCQDSPLAPVCDTLRQALRSGDATKCALKDDFQSICRKQITDLNEAQCRIVGPWMKRVTEAKCRAMVTLDKAACQVEQADLKSGEFSKDMPEFFKEAEGECKQKTEDRAFLGKGLNAIAESGPARERELAKAALGQADACAPFAQAAMDSCKGSGAGAPAPAGTSPPAGNEPGSTPAGNQGNPAPAA